IGSRFRHEIAAEVRQSAALNVSKVPSSRGRFARILVGLSRYQATLTFTVSNSPRLLVSAGHVSVLIAETVPSLIYRRNRDQIDHSSGFFSEFWRPQRFRILRLAALVQFAPRRAA